MHAETTHAELDRAETDRKVEAAEVSTIEWSAPDFTEQSACAEICAYVFSA